MIRRLNAWWLRQQPASSKPSLKLLRPKLNPEDPSGAVEARLVELLIEFAEWTYTECGHIDAIQHPHVEWCSFERYACYVWEVWAFGHRWLNCGGPEGIEFEIHSTLPVDPPGVDYIPYFSNWVWAMASKNSSKPAPGIPSQG